MKMKHLALACSLLVLASCAGTSESPQGSASGGGSPSSAGGGAASTGGGSGTGGSTGGTGGGDASGGGGGPTGSGGGMAGGDAAGGGAAGGGPAAGGGAGGGMATELTVEAYCAQLVAALCAKEVACGTYADQAACNSAYAEVKQRCLGAVPYRKELIFDATAAKACLAEVPAIQCRVVGAFATVYGGRCFNVIKANLSPGQACEFSAQCLGENYCPFVVSPTCPNTCSPRLAIGQKATREYDQCVKDAYFDSSYICRPKVGLGESCDSKSRGSPCRGDGNVCSNGKCVFAWTERGTVQVNGTCTVDPQTKAHDCVTGLQCKNSKCVPYGSAGDACTTQSECKRDLTCFNSKCSLPGKAGEACSDRTCSTGLYCVNSKCTNNGAVGDPCTSSSCKSGLICVAEKCSERLDVGGTCTQQYDCKNGLVCFNGKCANTAGVGEACTDTYPSNCQADLFCDENKKCAAKRPEGQPCIRSNTRPSCQDTLLCARTPDVGGKPGAPICQKPQPLGARCASYEGACAKGSYCKNNVCTTKEDVGTPCQPGIYTCKDDLECDYLTLKCSVRGVCR
jgi:hypothetical protein